MRHKPITSVRVLNRNGARKLTQATCAGQTFKIIAIKSRKSLSSVNEVRPITKERTTMMPYTQISNYPGNQLPPSLYFGTPTGDPGGGSTGGKRKAAKTTKKAAPKPKKKR